MVNWVCGVAGLITYAEKYYEKWNVTPVPVIYDNNGNMKPLVRWTPLYEKPEPVLISDEKLWERAEGIAIIPRRTHVVIDVDKCPYADDVIGRLKGELVIARTCRGFHIHANIDKAVGELRIYRFGEKIGEGGGALFRHLWTVPPTRRGTFCYKFVGRDGVPDLPRLRWEDLRDLIEVELDCKIEELTNQPVKGENVVVSADPVKGIDCLSVDQLKILLFLIFHDMNCYGLRDLTYEWIKTGTVNMRKFAWGSRTGRFYFLHTVAAILALLGVPHRKAVKVLETYEDLDGKPHDAHESALWTVYKWDQPLFRRLYVMRRGECPFCSIRRYRNCQKNPVLRFYYYLQSRGKDRVQELVDKLLKQ